MDFMCVFPASSELYSSRFLTTNWYCKNKLVTNRFLHIVAILLIKVLVKCSTGTSVYWRKSATLEMMSLYHISKIPPICISKICSPKPQCYCFLRSDRMPKLLLHVWFVNPELPELLLKLANLKNFEARSCCSA